MLENLNQRIKKCPGHQWLCMCDCGHQLVVSGNSLKQKNTESCGCLQKEKTSESRRIDLVGQVFGKLTVIKFIGERKANFFWLCKCECGKEKEINGLSLRAGRSKSCGCKQGNFIHGMTGKPGFKAFYLADPVRKIRHRVSVSVCDALKRKCAKKGGQTFNHLPYTSKELKEHLESQFEPWMNWDNYGGLSSSKEKTWHIDHIKPQFLFPYTSLKDPLFRECWDLSNLRPLEKIENIKKGKKFNSSSTNL